MSNRGLGRIKQKRFTLLAQAYLSFCSTNDFDKYREECGLFITQSFLERQSYVEERTIAFYVTSGFILLLLLISKMHACVHRL